MRLFGYRRMLQKRDNTVCSSNQDGRLTCVPFMPLCLMIALTLLCCIDQLSQLTESSLSSMRYGNYSILIF